MVLLLIIACFMPKTNLSGQTRAKIVLNLLCVHAVVINVIEEYVSKLNLSSLNISGTLVFWSVSFPVLLITFCSSYKIQIPVYSSACYILYKNYWYLYAKDSHYKTKSTEDEAKFEISIYIVVYFVVAVSVSTIIHY